MRVADLWFSSVLWVLLISNCSSLALATAKINSVFGIPHGGSTATKTALKAATVDASAAQVPTAVSSSSVASSSEVCFVSF